MVFCALQNRPALRGTVFLGTTVAVVLCSSRVMLVLIVIPYIINDSPEAFSSRKQTEYISYTILIHSYTDVVMHMLPD